MEFQADIESCLEILKSGGIFLYPTDTIWGIGCDATNQQAVQKIIDLKQRPEKKSFIVLVADDRDILKYASQPDLRIFDFLSTVNKPTTVIYEGAIGLADNLVSDDGTVAIRVISELFCKNLIKRFRKPIVSTSANRSGNTAPRHFGEIEDAIRSGVDYVVNYRRGDLQEQSPSALIRWNKDGTTTVIRS